MGRPLNLFAYGLAWMTEPDFSHPPPLPSFSSLWKMEQQREIYDRPWDGEVFFSAGGGLSY